MRLVTNADKSYYLQPRGLGKSVYEIGVHGTIDDIVVFVIPRQWVQKSLRQPPELLNSKL